MTAYRTSSMSHGSGHLWADSGLWPGSLDSGTGLADLYARGRR
jgi:hypothetical protein